MPSNHQRLDVELPDNYFHLFLLCGASFAITMLLTDALLSPEVLAMLRGITREGASPFTFVLVFTLASVVQVALAALIAGVVIQFTILIFSVEAPYSLTLDAALWGAWSTLGLALYKLVVISVLDHGLDPQAAAVIPGSLASFTGEPTGKLAPLDALLNLVNPFEALWIALVAWRLRWLRTYDTAPIRVAATVWALVTLPTWVLISLLPALI